MVQVENYNHKLTEKKWQKFWADNNTFHFDPNNKREKFYMLPMFLYPSGEMHVGHLRNFSISDVIARFKRLQGYNVLHPTGADAFGLPAENAAIKRGIHPSEWTYKNLDKIMKSMLSCGLSFDISRVFATCDPEYYGFQQKLFIDLYKHGLAYQKESYVNWDPVDQTVLANEQVIDGRGWRSDAIVEKKKLKQWFFKITKYADKLLDGIKNGDLKGWPEKVRLMQENWIGKSEGATVRFSICKDNTPSAILCNESAKAFDFIEVYTTRPDTLFGASFIGISANHPLAEELAKNNKEIADFIEECKKAPVDEESLETMEKKGIPTGIFVEHPFDKNWKLPVWIANFILMDYGTGAIFACPAHDQRDYDFATKYNLPIKPVVAPESEITQNSPSYLTEEQKIQNPPSPLRGRGQGLGVVSSRNYSQETLDKAKELRQSGNLPENILWEFLRNKKLENLKFKRQQPIDKYIVDFACLDKKLIIEIDGKVHEIFDEVKEKDNQRQKKLEELGYKVIRFNSKDVVNDTFGVLDKIINTVNEIHDVQMKGTPNPCTPSPQGGRGHESQNNENNFQFSTFNFQLPFTEEGIAINSDFLNGLPTKEAKQKAIEKIEELGIGERKINYRLRDWGVSRQRYWGCPIPMIYCEHCGVVPEKEENLPVKLPEDVVFDGKGNPLANHPTWKHTTCPCCGRPAIRETDTMDTFVDSSWYFMRFVDLDKKNPVNTELCNKMLPIDQYVGGIEHATMHLIYSRFFTKVMADMGYIDKSIKEPAKRLFNQGMVCHKAYKNCKKEWCYPWNVKEENGKYYDINTGEELNCQGSIKMSKSKCKVVDINTVIEDYGADAARLFVLSDTPADKDFEWTTEGIEGTWKYINRVWKIGATFALEQDLDKIKNIQINKKNELLIENHKAVKDITSYFNNMEFNKAIAKLREFSNFIEKAKINDDEDLAIKYLAISNLIKMLAPFAPHVCEELNKILKHNETLDIAEWPKFDEKFTVDSEITIAIQVNGKLRGEVKAKKDEDKKIVEELAKNQENVKKYLEGKEIKKVIIVPNRLINFVI